MNEMRATGITRFGGPDVLEAVGLPVPEPAARPRRTAG